MQHEKYLEILLLPKHIPAPSPPLVLKDLEKRYQFLMHQATFQQQVTEALQELTHLQVHARHVLGCERQPERPACLVKVSFQYHALREQPLAQVFAQALQGFLMASRSRSVVGVNLVQEEAGQMALRDYKAHMAVFNYLHHRYPKVPISLHAGELSRAMAVKHPAHIREVIEIGMRPHRSRAALLQEPHYQDYCSRWQSAHCRINLTSNQRLIHMQGGAHPLPLYLKYHVPIVLSSDDEGFLRTSLTREYFIAAQRYRLPYHTLKQFSRNALTYSFLPGRSLWQNPQHAQVVPVCRQLSQACRRFLARSEKARLQWALEREFEVFERGIARG